MAVFFFLLFYFVSHAHITPSCVCHVHTMFYLKANEAIQPFQVCRFARSRLTTSFCASAVVWTAASSNSVSPLFKRSPADPAVEYTARDCCAQHCDLFLLRVVSHKEIVSAIVSLRVRFFLEYYRFTTNSLRRLDRFVVSCASPS